MEGEKCHGRRAGADGGWAARRVLSALPLAAMGGRLVSEEPTRPPRGAEYAVSLPSFEGPLDLLLHLCQKHELDILQIPVGFVTEKYLEYLAVMQLMHLDIASEYLVMAATLAHIKSKMLLPAPPPGQEDDAEEDEEDPREALIRRLLEYQKYKQAAVDLAARGMAGRDVFLRGVAIEESVKTELPPLAEVPLYAIVEAFQRVLSRSKVKLSHDIVADRISITDRIVELTDLIMTRRRLLFDDLFDGVTSRFDLVITFLALLEMTRLRLTTLVQTDPLAPLYVEARAAEATADDTALAEGQEPHETHADTVVVDVRADEPELG
jgi:segregation and condensation protein A